MNCTTGIILTGGAGRRMGAKKAELPWGNETILQHLVRNLLPRLEPILVVGSTVDSPMDLPDRVVLINDKEPHQGPLAGFHNGLAHAPVDQPVFLCGCDFPFLKSSVIDFLEQHLEYANAVLPETDGMSQPLVALYQPCVFRMVDELVEKGARSMNALLTEIEYWLIKQEQWQHFDPNSVMLTNINTQQEYADAHHRYLASLEA